VLCSALSRPFNSSMIAVSVNCVAWMVRSVDLWSGVPGCDILQTLLCLAELGIFFGLWGSDDQDGEFGVFCLFLAIFTS